MSPELNETIGLIVAGLSLFVTVVMIICLWVMTKRNLELRKTINLKQERIKSSKDLIKSFSEELISYWDKYLEKKDEILRLKQENEQYRFVMAISDEITEDMQREIESLTIERDTLKAKLNHKKRPANGNS